MILTLNFTNAYWERISAITIKKILNGPALSLYPVRPGTVACSVKARAHILDRVWINTELLVADMKRRRLAAEKDSWEEFEKRFGNKRNNAKKSGMGSSLFNSLTNRGGALLQCSR